MIKTLKPESGKDRMSTLDYAVAGAISAFPTSLVCSPMERIKVLLQTGAESSGKYKAALNEMTRGGIKSFYSGLGATLARDIPGSALYFGAYEYFSAILNPTGQAKSISSVILSGGLAGVSMWALVIVSFLRILTHDHVLSVHTSLKHTAHEKAYRCSKIKNTGCPHGNLQGDVRLCEENSCRERRCRVFPRRRPRYG